MPCRAKECCWPAKGRSTTVYSIDGVCVLPNLASWLAAVSQSIHH